MSFRDSQSWLYFSFKVKVITSMFVHHFGEGKHLFCDRLFASLIEEITDAWSFALKYS